MQRSLRTCKKKKKPMNSFCSSVRPQWSISLHIVPYLKPHIAMEIHCCTFYFPAPLDFTLNIFEAACSMC